MSDLWLKRVATIAAVAGAMALVVGWAPSMARADDTAAQVSPAAPNAAAGNAANPTAAATPGEPSEEAEESGGLSIEAKLTIPTSYVFRGYVLEEDHALFQPEVTISYGTELGGLKVTPYVTAWANLSDAPAPGEPEWFNELDLYVGADIELSHGLTLGVVYDYYNSPADVFDDVHEVGITLTHDDVLNPSIGVYREIDDRGGREDTYVELGLTPGFDMPKFEKLHFDFPLVAGLTPDKYYTDSSGDSSVLGFLSAGTTGTYAFNDHWAVEAGVDYVQMVADSAKASNSGDDHQWVGHLGLTFTK